MTLPELLALTDPKLDLACAEAMGWKDLGDGGLTGLPLGWVMPGGTGPFKLDRWRPSRDHNDAHRLLEEVERRGKATQFACDRAIGDLTGYDPDEGDPTYYLLVVLPARTKTIAAIAALKGE